MVEAEGSVPVDLGDEVDPDVEADVAYEMEGHANALAVVGGQGGDTVVVGLFLRDLDEVVTEAFGCCVVDELQNPDLPCGHGIVYHPVLSERRVDIGHEQGEVEVVECVEQVRVPWERTEVADGPVPEGEAVSVCVEGVHERHERVLVILFHVGCAGSEGNWAVLPVRVEDIVDIVFGGEPFSVEVAS